MIERKHDTRPAPPTILKTNSHYLVESSGHAILCIVTSRNSTGHYARTVV